MKRTLLLTGATGFLGRHITAECIAQGVPVVALVRDAGTWPPAWSEGVGESRGLLGSPMEPRNWLEQPGLSDVGTVMHAAGVVRHSRQGAEDTEHVNVESTLQMVRAAHALGARFVLISTSGAVGCFRSPEHVADEHAPFVEGTVGAWPYYLSKIRAEREGRKLADKLGVPMTVIRPPMLLGPGDHRRRSTSQVSRVIERRLPFVPSGGLHFTDIRDVASALVRLTQLESPRDVYHFPGTDLPLSAFFQMVGEVAGEPVRARSASRPLLQGIATATEHLRRVTNVPLPAWLPDPVVLEMASHYWGLSTLWTHTDLGYAPRLPRQTLADTVEWLRGPEASAQQRHSHAA